MDQSIRTYNLCRTNFLYINFAHLYFHLCGILQKTKVLRKNVYVYTSNTYNGKVRKNLRFFSASLLKRPKLTIYTYVLYKLNMI